MFTKTSNIPKQRATFPELHAGFEHYTQGVFRFTRHVLIYLYTKVVMCTVFVPMYLESFYLPTFWYASSDLKDDKDVVIAAVRRNGNAFIHVNKTADMWKDKDFVLPMVQMCHSALKFAADNCKADKDVIQAAVAQNGHALQYRRVS